MEKAAILLLLIFVALSQNANAMTPHVDLNDLVKNGTPADRDEARALIVRINENPAELGIPTAVLSPLTYSSNPLSSVGQNTISTALVQNQTPYGFELFLVYTFGKKVLLNKVAFDFYGRVLNFKTFDLSRNPPVVQLDIVNRQLLMQESKSGFLKFAPASMGAFVLNELGNSSSGYRSLSKPFRKATLSKSKSELSRVEPDYYAGRPFLRIIDHDQSSYGGFTAFGIHYQISDVLLRGFISNGCFRLRDTDLYELANLVFLSKKNGLSLSVVNETANGNRHPYPMINSWYNTPRVTNDARGKLVLETEEHGLYIFDKVSTRPLDLLKN